MHGLHKTIIKTNSFKQFLLYRSTIYIITHSEAATLVYCTW